MGCMSSKTVVVVTPKPASHQPADPKAYESNHREHREQPSQADASSSTPHNPVINKPLIQEKKPVEVQKDEKKKVDPPKQAEESHEKKPQEEKVPKLNRFKAGENQIINQQKNKETNDYVEPKETNKVQVDSTIEREIYPNFKKIGVEQYDRLLAQASKILRAVEETRLGIEDAKEKAVVLSNVILLKEENIKEIIQVLFWTISANHNGKIKGSGVEVFSESPFIKLNKLKMKVDEAQELYDAFTQYLNAINKGTVEVQEAEKILIEINQQVLELKNHTEEEIAKSNMRDDQKAKALKRQERYSHVYLPKELAKVARLVPIIEKEVEEMKGIAEKLQEIFDGADEIGGKVNEEYVKMKGGENDTEMDNDIEFILAPAQIFNKYCKEVRKDLKEMDEYSKELKKRKDQAKEHKMKKQREDQD